MGHDIVRCPRCGAEIPLTEALTGEIDRFGLLDGIWIADYRHAPLLATDD
ncbi:MAG: hypothetical protein JXR83_11080 [Deltaproteobacteria bacterium]|nr:hypothetical protein [Deltaproteobacteria bacterium]